MRVTKYVYFTDCVGKVQCVQKDGFCDEASAACFKALTVSSDVSWLLDKM